MMAIKVKTMKLTTKSLWNSFASVSVSPLSDPSRFGRNNRGRHLIHPFLNTSRQ